MKYQIIFGSTTYGNYIKYFVLERETIEEVNGLLRETCSYLFTDQKEEGEHESIRVDIRCRDEKERIRYRRIVYLSTLVPRPSLS